MTNDPGRDYIDLMFSMYQTCPQCHRKHQTLGTTGICVICTLDQIIAEREKGAQDAATEDST